MSNFMMINVYKYQACSVLSAGFFLYIGYSYVYSSYNKQSTRCTRQVDALVTRYIQDDAARERLQSCAMDAVNSTAWMQLKG